ncbi:unnamed protein product [Rotaria sordida]|uniref:Protein sleepless n=1 Tax=Rotaria sordida TaxID=392033 RepID=A0A814QHP9_9BILA|nr:unnamed protein product [Rotaria sordida]CAF3851356.1 unnamed protein product [Rotaria sordida]
MNTKLLIIFVLLSVIIGSIARQCYKCTACPRPFKGNEGGVGKVDVGDNDYCQKTIALGIENRDSGGNDCTPIDKLKYCCKGDLCNGATTVTATMKLLVAAASLLFVAQFFQ